MSDMIGLPLGNSTRGDAVFSEMEDGAIEVSVANPINCHSDDEAVMRMDRSEARMLWAWLGQRLGLGD